VKRRRRRPAFRFDERFHAIAVFTGLEVETFGAHPIVERRKRQHRPFSLLHEDEGRRQTAVALRADQIAAGERVSQQHLVVARIEKRRAAGGQTPARDAAKDHRHGFDRAVHLRVDAAFDGGVAPRQPSRHAARRLLLPSRPDQLCAVDLESLIDGPHDQVRVRQAVGILVREHAKPELVAVEGDRWLRKVEAEFLEAAAARRDEDIARRRLRDDGAVWLNGRW
jgi:hypothetical protein